MEVPLFAIGNSKKKISDLKNSKIKKKVLIIEDNLFMAELLSEKIKQIETIEAVTALDGSEGLKALEKEKFSGVILDLPLSGEIDGFEILKRIRSTDKTKNLPVITLFNLDDEDGIKKSTEFGATTVFIKSINTTEEIVKKVGELINRDKETQAVQKETIKPVRKATSKIVKKKALEVTISIEAPRRIKEKIDKLLSMPTKEISIITLVDNLIEYAFLARASDIHFEPLEETFLARMRIDGILHDVFTLPREIQSGVITRIKILGGMRTDEHQTSQDGRFKAEIKNPPRRFDIRVSIVPTYYRENAVLRLLAEQSQVEKLDDLTFIDTDKLKIRHAIDRPYGMILATGPTGSGKTTTLYTILKELNTREVSIITIEDPIEYSLDGVDQIQVNPHSGLTFANGLRAILRQDPDIIMVGEIRDEEAATIAVNAALTGHKLLSTLHTNDAATTIPRLLDMGIEPFLAASTVNIAIGQRLVRMICNACKTKKQLTEGEFKNLAERIPPEILENHRDFYFSKGCDECGGSGYLGRIGLYEVLEVNDFIREAVIRRASASEIKKIAIKNGMTTLLEDGFKKALQGITTLEEVLRVIQE